MKGRLTLRTLTLLIVVLPSIAWAQFTDPRPAQRVGDQYSALLFSREFDRLDADMDAAKARNLKSSDGQPILQFMHSGVAGCSCINYTDELWMLHKQRLDEWGKRKPQSLNARLALAGYPLAYGWFRRTGGYASQVSEEGWAQFRKGVQDTGSALMALDAEAKADPRWFVEMMGLALASGWPREDFETLLEQATAKYPEYYAFYFTAAEFYSRRWYGNREQQNELIERAAARGGDVLYARLKWSTASDGLFVPPLDRTDWNRMRDGFDEIMKAYPDPWNLNHFARFACQAGDGPTTRQLINLIGDKPIAKAWNDDLRTFQRCNTATAKFEPRKSPW